jgi:hypothetical protein
MLVFPLHHRQSTLAKPAAVVLPPFAPVAAAPAPVAPAVAAKKVAVVHYLPSTSVGHVSLSR